MKANPKWCSQQLTLASSSKKAKTLLGTVDHTPIVAVVTGHNQSIRSLHFLVQHIKTQPPDLKERISAALGGKGSLLNILSKYSYGKLASFVFDFSMFLLFFFSFVVYE
ncbi:hypothetical protein C5167_009327 [Papaver somniferum]|uniref:Uncharacterized protein n=1 Tax=Papaver somniferum TaxID=3469 RepID=A0A4Y7JX33_PAPSO|nr:hypothetical protein C5167_009327 [Papaver somniferum]